MEDQARYYPGSVDSHMHSSLLASKELEERSVLEAATAGRMERLVDVGVAPSDLAPRLTRLGAYRILAFTAGLHPTGVSPETLEHEIGILAESLSGAMAGRIVAVGEIGLDFYWSTENTTLQIDALERQCALAAKHELPVIIHNRDSEEQMLHILRRLRPQGVMHCFSQGPEYCAACLDLDMHLSFGGNLTYRRSDEIRRAAELVPDERLLVETDAPFLSPQAVRGTPNHPGHLAFVIEALAALRGTSADAIARLTAANARRLFRL
ncbi:MAG: TatD family hydrolase [Spirochaetota bacterium]